MDRNRHGIPTYTTGTPRASSAQRCVWPKCHKRFAAHVVAGREWFRPAPEIREYIEGVIAVHGRCLDPFRERLNEKRSPVQMRPRSTPYGRGRAVR